MKSNKAIGVDGLPDYVLKDPGRRELIIDRLMSPFNKWMNGEEQLPEYLKTTKVIPLSKVDGELYPNVGMIRTIAVATSLMKVYEKVILAKLKPEIERTGAISEEQNAYRSGKSTLYNLDNTIS